MNTAVIPAATRHQWCLKVTPGLMKNLPWGNVLANTERFAKHLFGDSAKVWVTGPEMVGKKGFATAKQASHRGVFLPGAWVIQISTEGHPQDEAYAKHVLGQFQRFFENGFGAGTTIAYEIEVFKT